MVRTTYGEHHDASARGLAEVLGGDFDTLTVEDILMVRVSDMQEAISRLQVEDTGANPIQKGVASKMIAKVASEVLRTK